MNRQFRRAQEKQDKKQEKEKEKRREERRAKLRSARRAREKNRSDKSRTAKVEPERSGAGDGRPAARGRVPGRFSGVLAAVTVFFITLQSVAPVEEEQGWGASLIAAGFYLMLGYFATLWFMRRDTARAPVLSIVGGILLAASVAVVQFVQDRPIDLLALALTIPALVAGALLGRLVFVATPR